MKSSRIATFAAAIMILAGPATAATYATTATTTDVTSFGSGVLTGAPDSGGAFLSDTFDPPRAAGSIVFGFDVDLFDGPGDDFRLIDVGQTAAELYDVAISSDGLGFTSLGIFDTTAEFFDVAGAFAGIFSFIRVTNAGSVNSPDLDAAEALNIAAPIPVPAALPLLLTALGGLGVAGWRRRRASAA